MRLTLHTFLTLDGVLQAPGGRRRGRAQTQGQPGGELQVHGSGELATYLINQGLVDEFRVLTFPVYLGAGKKLFRGRGAPRCAPASEQLDDEHRHRDQQV
ncbi:MAG TPA: dihydrofolate reductase family protein [Frankiaceae bacterium]|nr:dihydrofolate reductase family protein [Frankiaceae bacterium]